MICFLLLHTQTGEQVPSLTAISWVLWHLNTGNVTLESSLQTNENQMVPRKIKKLPNGQHVRLSGILFVGSKGTSGSWALVSFFHCVGTGGHIRAIRIGGKCLYLLSYLTGPFNLSFDIGCHWTLNSLIQLDWLSSEPWEHFCFCLHGTWIFALGSKLGSSCLCGKHYLLNYLPRVLIVAIDLKWRWP